MRSEPQSRPTVRRTSAQCPPQKESLSRSSTAESLRSVVRRRILSRVIGGYPYDGGYGGYPYDYVSTTSVATPITAVTTPSDTSSVFKTSSYLVMSSYVVTYANILLLTPPLRRIVFD